MWWSWRNQTPAEKVLAIVATVIIVVGAITSFFVPGVAGWFSWVALPVLIALIVIRYRRWDNGRVSQTRVKD
jgi:hypothetical protein